MVEGVSFLSGAPVMASDLTKRRDSKPFRAIKH